MSLLPGTSNALNNLIAKMNALDVAGEQLSAAASALNTANGTFNTKKDARDLARVEYNTALAAFEAAVLLEEGVVDPPPAP
jgi:hypothetical protein